MRASDPYERLQSARRQAGYKSAADAARAFGWNVVTYRAHENGTRGLKRDAAERYDPGDIVVCSRESRSPDSVLNVVAAVRTTDGRRYLKRILPGARPGTYDLESFNAETIRGVQLAWIGEILATVPASRARKANGREPKAVARQTAKAAG